MSMWEWAGQNSVVFAVLAYLVFVGVERITKRFLRAVMVVSRGWPEGPHMDADGDIVYPKPKAVDEIEMN